MSWPPPPTNREFADLRVGQVFLDDTELKEPITVSLPSLAAGFIPMELIPPPGMKALKPTSFLIDFGYRPDPNRVVVFTGMLPRRLKKLVRKIADGRPLGQRERRRRVRVPSADHGLVTIGPVS